MQPLTDAARAIYAQALANCSVEPALTRSVRMHQGVLEAGETRLPIGDLLRIRIVACGKAAGNMTRAMLGRLAGTAARDMAGVVIAPQPPADLPQEFAVFAGGHPLPDAASFAGAQAALALARDAATARDPARTLCLFLVSGGASSMMELPLDPVVTVEETAAFHRALVTCGAPIAAINCVRKHFSAVKGGRLARAAGAALMHTLLVSDVPRGHLDAVGSGPTVPDVSTVEDCRQILDRYRLLPRFPESVRHFFESVDLPETPKPGELHGSTTLLLDSANVANAAAAHARALGFHAVVDHGAEEQEYRAAAEALVDRLERLRREHGRVCLVSAGEVRVALPPENIGTGGRNQHFALYAATLLQKTKLDWAVLSAGTDGVDGNSPAAGAVVDRSILRDRRSRAEAAAALEQFDSYSFLASHGCTVGSGPTGNNLRDLRLLFAV